MIESELRQQIITGTDATAICGINGFRTEADVYLAKKYPSKVTPPTGIKKKMLEMGLRYEPIIAQMYAERMHCSIYKPLPRTFRSDKVEWIGGSPDFLWKGQRRGLECKKVSSERYFHQKGEFGPDGSDQVPYEYLIQCTHYMMLCGFTEWDLAALIGDADFRVYRLHLDKELAAMLLGKEEAFYNKYIVGDEEPRFTTEDLMSLLKKKYPTHAEKRVIEVHPTDLELKTAIEKLLRARAFAKGAADALDEAKITVMKEMGDAAELIWERSDEKDAKPLKIMWKKNRDGVKTDWKTVALRALDFAPQDQREKIVKEHSEPKQGARVFKVYGEEDEEGQD